MAIGHKKEAILLFVGDIVFLLLSLWLMLAIRYGQIPTPELWREHIIPFSILFIISILVFFIAGLYEKHTLLIKRRLPYTIFNTQVINTALAVLFFYSIPYFGITPKTNLFIYLVVSFILIALWRIYGQHALKASSRENALLVGSGQEMKELLAEVNNNNRYDIHFISSIDLDEMESLDFQEEILNRVYSENVHVVVVDLKNDKVTPMLSSFYNLIFSKVRFIDMHRVYEDIFDRVPLSMVQDNWFIENVSTGPRIAYDSLKRIMDIVISLVVGIISLVFYPFVILAIKIDDGGSIFSVQTRIGVNNKKIKILKFRTMSRGDQDGRWDDIPNENTKVGAFLRKTRIDELPQLWNVLRGEVSLIGPRPEMPEPVKKYADQISYYNIRHIIKPGLSGWAQIKQDVDHPHHEVETQKTKEKLSYDLYYIKNRSFLLDLKIALKTLKTLIMVLGK